MLHKYQSSEDDRCEYAAPDRGCDTFDQFHGVHLLGEDEDHRVNRAADTSGAAGDYYEEAHERCADACGSCYSCSDGFGDAEGSDEGTNYDVDDAAEDAYDQDQKERSHLHGHQGICDDCHAADAVEAGCEEHREKDCHAKALHRVTETCNKAGYDFCHGHLAGCFFACFAACAADGDNNHGDH